MVSKKPLTQTNMYSKHINRGMLAKCVLGTATARAARAGSAHQLQQRYVTFPFMMAIPDEPNPCAKMYGT
jgi:hypothetical protein